jgi:hypothetical protein
MALHIPKSFAKVSRTVANSWKDVGPASKREVGAAGRLGKGFEP